MSIRTIAAFVIAALLLTGTAGVVAENTKSDGADAMPAYAENSGQSSAVADTALTELTKETAISIALNHAGLVESDVTGLRGMRDADDGIIHYDVSFHSGDWAYEYEIGAVSGVVLDWDRDYEPVVTKPAVADPVPEVSQALAPVEPESVVIELTAEEAVATALMHAGVTAGEVTRLAWSYEVDDGWPEWSVSFCLGMWEYEYEIHGGTGVFLEWDKEIED